MWKICGFVESFPPLRFVEKWKTRKIFLWKRIINKVLHSVDNLIHEIVENFVVNRLLFFVLCAIIKTLWSLEI